MELSVSTQVADGHIGKLKTGCRGHTREYVKEKQWGANWLKKQDLYLHFAGCWAEVGRDSRSGFITLDSRLGLITSRDAGPYIPTSRDVRSCAASDHSGYGEQSGVNEYDSASGAANNSPEWVCPGRDRVIWGGHCARKTFARAKKCPSYKNTPVGDTAVKTVLPGRRKDFLPSLQMENGLERNATRGVKPQRGEKENAFLGQLSLKFLCSEEGRSGNPAGTTECCGRGGARLLA